MTYHKLSSPPLKVIWQGFESDTYTLSKNGWDLSISEERNHMSFNQHMVLVMRHEAMQLYGISREIDFNHYRNTEDPRYWEEVVIHIRQVASDIHFQYMSVSPRVFNAIDPIPEYQEAETLQRLSEMPVFRTFASNPEEILLAKPTLDQVLKYALDLQEPRQKEIRQEMLKRGPTSMEPSIPVKQVKAQLMLVA